MDIASFTRRSADELMLEGAYAAGLPLYAYFRDMEVVGNGCLEVGDWRLEIGEKGLVDWVNWRGWLIGLDCGNRDW